MSELDYLLSGDPNDKVRWHRELDAYGDLVYGGRRTIAHLEYTNERAIKRFGVGIVVLQGGFNTDVDASEGTHDYDACIDMFIPGVDWWTQQRFFRECGWANWYRYPPSFGSHTHGISLGCTGRVGEFVPGQIADYYNHKTGLAGHANDPSWHPADIRSTIFDYAAWKADKEDELTPQDKEWLDGKFAALEKSVDQGRKNSLERDRKLIKKLTGVAVDTSQIEAALTELASAEESA